MKQWSIKVRVTLWYVGLLMVILSAGAAILLSFAGQISNRKIRETLIDMVTDTVQSAEFDHGDLDMYHMDFYRSGVSVFIYDSQGHLLAPKINRGLQIDAVLTDQSARQVQFSGEEWMIYDLYAVKEKTGYWVRGIVSMSETSQTLSNMIVLTIIGIPACLLVACWGGWTITKRAFRPVGEMASTAQAISSGNDLSLRIPLRQDRDSSDELALLGQTFNSMLSRLQASFENERQFTSDVSHELRTPVSVILTQCEYGLSDISDERDKIHALESVMTQGKRMHHIISQLLLLARAENGNFAPQWERINLTVLCDMTILEMKETAHEADVTIESILEEDIWVTGDETLLIRLLTNLISNAIHYNHHPGWVKVTLQKQTQGCVLKVQDSGIGISAENLGKIWNRFYRQDASRRSEGTGLGLAMADWIIRLHSGTAHVESNPGKGSTFTIMLPGPAQCESETNI